MHTTGVNQNLTLYWIKKVLFFEKFLENIFQNLSKTLSRLKTGDCEYEKTMMSSCESAECLAGSPGTGLDPPIPIISLFPLLSSTVIHNHNIKTIPYILEVLGYPNVFGLFLYYKSTHHNLYRFYK